MAVSSSPNASPQIKNQKKPERNLAQSEPIPDSAQPSQPSAAPVKARRKRTKSPGVRMVGGRLYDSENGQTCHQCRQKTMDIVAACKNISKEKPCKCKFCKNCLSNRYGEIAAEVNQIEGWNCPKCRGICNCSFCMKKRGHEPTGILAHTAKATGFQSVSQMLIVNGPKKAQQNPADGSDDSSPSKTKNVKKQKRKRSEDCDTNEAAIGGDTEVRIRKNKLSTEEHINASNIVTDGDEKKPKMRKTKIKTVSWAQSVRNTEEPSVSINSSENGKEKIIETGSIDKDKPKKSQNRKKRIVDPASIQGSGGKDNGKDKPKLINDQKHKNEPDADITLPQGFHLTTVASIELPCADVGPALQFLEFCTAFEEILKLKKGEAQSVLQELTSGCKLPRRQYSSVIPFHEKLLSLIKKDMGEEHLISPSSKGLKEISECFDGGNDVYETFDTSKRLRLVNLLCDTALSTKHLRGWIDAQNELLVKSRKEAQEEIRAAKDKEKRLKKQMQDEVAKEIILRNGAPLSVSEHENLISTIKSEAAKAHAEKLAVMGMIPQKKHRSDAVRTEPVLLTENGLRFWKLSGYSAEPSILLQDVGKCDSDESEKWFTYDVEQREDVEKYISHQRCRRKMLRSQVVRDSSIEGTNTTVNNESSDSPHPNESD